MAMGMGKNRGEQDANALESRVSSRMDVGIRFPGLSQTTLRSH